MRIVTLEEHFQVPDLIARIGKDRAASRGWPSSDGNPDATRQDELADVGERRLADMDAAGVTMQVLSASGPGADLLPADAGPDLARAYNDRLGQIVTGRPDRFAGFAHLPMTAPEAAADELERAVLDLGFSGALVNGLTQGCFLDNPMFDPILARAAALDVPLYLHPNVPPAGVRDAYYSDLADPMPFLLSTAGFGWHAETAIHVLRLVLSGTLDRHPGLKLIIGHMGETLPMMLARADHVFGKAVEQRLDRAISQTILDQVWITTSGFFSLAPFTAAMMTFGADRILFSVDYPFSPNKAGTDFLRRLPVSPADLEKIAHGNADGLLKLEAC
jgi:predicted TIM-barrel fold metal-dependent hydrolase